MLASRPCAGGRHYFTGSRPVQRNAEMRLEGTVERRFRCVPTHRATRACRKRHHQFHRPRAWCLDDPLSTQLKIVMKSRPEGGEHTKIRPKSTFRPVIAHFARLYILQLKR